MKEANTSVRCQPKVRVSRGGVGGELDGRQGQEEGKKVEEDVGRIGKERQGVGPDPAGHLGDEGEQRSGLWRI